MGFVSVIFQEGVHVLPLLYLLINIQVATCNTTVPTSSPHKLLEAKLFENYGSTYQRPVWNTSNTVEVSLRFLPSELIYLSEINQVLSISALMTQSWKDEFLTWNPEEENGIHVISTSRDTLWSPDMTVSENVDIGFIRFQDTPVTVYSNGTIIWFVPMITTTMCSIKVRYFPFDTQICNITFSSWTHDVTEISLIHKNNVDASQNVFSQNGVWELETVTTVRKLEKYSCCEHPYSLITYSLYLRRSSLFYVNTIITPCILLSFMSLFVFWLPPDAGQKIYLAITNMLTLSLFQQHVADSLPPLGNELPLLVTYFSAMIVMGWIAVLGTVVVLCIYHKGGDNPPPEFIRRFMRSKIPHYLFGSRSSSGEDKGHPRSIVLERLEKIIKTIEANDVPDGKTSSDALESGSSQTKSDLYNAQYLQSLVYLKKSLASEKREEIKEEWKDLAHMLDMLLFVGLFVATLITLIVVCAKYGAYSDDIPV